MNEDTYQCDACDAIMPRSELQNGIPSAGIEGSFCAKCRGESEIAEHQTGANLIAHLEAGGLIARGDPRHIEFLRFEIYGENRVKHLGCYGWGSALGRVENRLMDVMENPHTWICVPLDVKPPHHEEAASELLSALGRYVNYEWKLVVQDERPVNTRTEKSKADVQEQEAKQ